MEQNYKKRPILAKNQLDNQTLTFCTINSHHIMACLKAQTISFEMSPAVSFCLVGTLNSLNKALLGLWPRDLAMSFITGFPNWDFKNLGRPKSLINKVKINTLITYMLNFSKNVLVIILNLNLFRKLAWN